MVWAALIVGAVAAQPGAGVHVSLAAKVTPAKQAEATAFVNELVTSAGMRAVPLNADCDDDTACIVEAAKAGGLAAVVLVTLGPKEAALEVDLEARRTRQAGAASPVTFALDSARKPAVREQLRALADTLRAWAKDEAAEAPDPRAAQASPAAGATPVPVPDALVESAARTSEPSAAARPATGVAHWLLGGGALVSGVTCLALGLVGLGQQQAAEATPDGIHATEKQLGVTQQISTANTLYTASLVAGLLAAALAVTALLVWLSAR